MKPHALAASLASLAAAAALHAQTRVVYVDQTAPAGGDGSTWQRAFRNVQSALDPYAGRTVVQSVEIRVAQGTYRPTIGLSTDPGFSLTPRLLNSGVTLSLLGSFAGLRGPDPDAVDYIRTPTVLTGDVLGNDAENFGNRSDNRGPVLAVREQSSEGFNSAFVIDGFQIRGGRHYDSSYAGASGGGFVFGRYGSRVTVPSYVANLLVEDCEAYNGGGISMDAYNTFEASVELRRCVVRGNRALRQGGGLLLHRATAFDCILENNTAESGGGALLAGGGLRSCVVRSNTARFGGGIARNEDWDGAVFSCLIVGNHAQVGGGYWGGGGQLVNCTIVHNDAVYGGGAHRWAAMFSSGTVANCILAGNRATENGSQLSVAMGIVQLRSCLLEGGLADVFNPFAAEFLVSNMIESSPRFVLPDGPDHNPDTFDDNDYRLSRSSPAIDAADEDYGVYSPYDLDGNPRSQPRALGRVPHLDLGCYEYQPRCPADINQDDGITVDDLLAFINAYTLGQPLADIDDGSATNTPDDGVTIDDLLYFLARYNQGC